MYRKLLKPFIAAIVLSTSAITHAEIDGYDVREMGHLLSPMESARGIVLTNNRYSEIYAYENGQLSTILQGRNCGLYTNISKDGKLIGFKSFDEEYRQAPAILDVTTGIVTFLEGYTKECGQVSFSDNGTMAYTMGNKLIVRKVPIAKALTLDSIATSRTFRPTHRKWRTATSTDKCLFLILQPGQKKP